ncbi:MAG: uroporphyrinogen-III synthase [Methylocapsa sp.]|nr:uroporphyrinogen-III synthase [Methylocapsa sp.]
MLVLLTRAIDESRQTGVRLAREGHEAIISPVIEMVPTGAVWPTGVIDAVIGTSARAFELLSSRPDWPLPEARRLMPLFVAGEKTRDAARERGFGGPALVAPDAATLAEKIESCFDSPCRFVYLAGRDRSAELETKLTGIGHSIELVQVYAAQPADSLTEEAVALARSGKIGVVLHYSRRSAEIYLRLGRNAGLDLARVNHVCISQNAAAPLLAAGIHEVLVAKAPNEQAMFGILNVLADLPEAPLAEAQNWTAGPQGLEQERT